MIIIIISNERNEEKSGGAVVEEAPRHSKSMYRYLPCNDNEQENAG